MQVTACHLRVSHALTCFFYSCQNVLAIGPGKVLFDLWPAREKEPRSSVISEPPLPQYIYLDGSMRLQPRNKTATLQRVYETDVTEPCRL